ncbi:isochorismatase family protein [Sorangium sp. So ce291]|uniref:isochorismatase family protein n=1 Tax=Sorangium sp. So ce291 TaxID=3133294 RepID=UPI003F6373AD
MKQRSALVIIDVQNGVLDGKAPVQGASALLANLGALLSRARARGVPVVHAGRPREIRAVPLAQIEL